jgi:hypothetical protein
MRHANVGLQMIMERRARDATNRLYEEAARQDTVAREQLQFDSRTHSHFEGRELQRRALQHKEDAEMALDDRRARLFELLKADEDRFGMEIASSHETPALRRARLQRQLSEMQKKSQEEHDAEVERRLHNRWIEECDPLRAKISHAFERQVAHERHDQIVERDLRRMATDDDTRRYADHVREEVREDQERRAGEEADRRRKQQQSKEAWTAHMQRRQDALIREREADREEGMRARQRHAEEVRDVELATEHRRQSQVERRRELDAVNAASIEAKRRKAAEERRYDEMCLQRTKEELRRETEASMVERLIAKRRANADREQAARQALEAAEGDRAADLYVQQTADEADSRRDEARRIDLEKRRRLMLDANRAQIDQMHVRERGQEQGMRERIAERARIEAEAQKERERAQEEAEKKRLMMQNQQQVLGRQVSAQRENEARRKREERDSVRALLANQADEERRIEEVMKHPEDFIGKRFRGYR